MALSKRMNFELAVEVWPLHWNGLYQHQIAAELGLNQGRISEVLTEKRFAGSKAEALRRR